MTETLVTITRVKPLEARAIAVRFSDGASGVVDLSGILGRDTEMTRPLTDPAFFARVFLEEGAPTWPNGFDLAPWALYEDLKREGGLDLSGRAS